MKCSRKEITIQVFGKTTKHGLKSVTVVSKSHWQSPVIDSRGYTEWNTKEKKNPSKNRIPATHNAVSPVTWTPGERPSYADSYRVICPILGYLSKFCSRVNFPLTTHNWTATRPPLWFIFRFSPLDIINFVGFTGKTKQTKRILWISCTVHCYPVYRGWGNKANLQSVQIKINKKGTIYCSAGPWHHFKDLQKYWNLDSNEFTNEEFNLKQEKGQVRCRRHYSRIWNLSCGCTTTFKHLNVYKKLH